MSSLAEQIARSSDILNPQMESEQIGVNIGERLRTERMLKGLSVTELADRAGISKAYVSQLEAGAQQNPSLDVLKKLADALEITVGRLIGGEVAAPASLQPPPPGDPGLYEFLEERRKRGRPVPEEDVQLLLRLQWRGGAQGTRPRTKEDWASFYEHLLPMWERGTGAEHER